MTRLRELFEDAAGSPPSSPYTANSIYAAGRRRRLRANTARAATGVLAIAAMSGTAYVAAQPYGLGGTAADRGTTTSVISIAVDGDHLYATLEDCPPGPTDGPTYGPTYGPTDGPTNGSTSDPTASPDNPGASGSPRTDPNTGTVDSGGPGTTNPGGESSNRPDPHSGDPRGCRLRNVESTDRGRTWKTTGISVVAVPQPGVIAAEARNANALPGVGRVSVDRGVTWHDIVRQDTPIAAVPDGGWATTYFAAQNQEVLGVDPRTGIVRPLANQPPFPVIEPWDPIQTGAMVTGAIVVYGQPADGVPQRYAISRDGGRTWSAHTRPTVEQSTLPLVYTTDGLHLYAVSDRNGDHTIRYLVSDDGGSTWSPQRTVPDDLVVGWLVRPDGSVVLATANLLLATGDSPRTSFWITHDNGVHFERFTGMHGLPAAIDVRITRNSDGGYLARPTDGSRTFYLSRDGLNWQQVRIR